MNGGNNGVDRDRESRRDSTQSIGRLPKPADWKRRLRSVVRDRAPIQTDSGSGYRVSQVAFHGPGGGLAQSHSLSRCTKGRGGLTATMPCLYTNRSLPDESTTSNADKCECRGCFDANFPRPTIKRFANPVNTNLLCCLRPARSSRIHRARSGCRLRRIVQFSAPPPVVVRSTLRQYRVLGRRAGPRARERAAFVAVVNLVTGQRS